MSREPAEVTLIRAYFNEDRTKASTNHCLYNNCWSYTMKFSVRSCMTLDCPKWTHFAWARTLTPLFDVVVNLALVQAFLNDTCRKLFVSWFSAFEEHPICCSQPGWGLEIFVVTVVLSRLVMLEQIGRLNNVFSMTSSNIIC